MVYLKRYISSKLILFAPSTHFAFTTVLLKQIPFYILWNTVFSFETAFLIVFPPLNVLFIIEILLAIVWTELLLTTGQLFATFFTVLFFGSMNVCIVCWTRVGTKLNLVFLQFFTTNNAVLCFTFLYFSNPFSPIYTIFSENFFNFFSIRVICHAKNLSGGIIQRFTIVKHNNLFYYK